MKTAISIPDDLYEAAEAAARRLGLSRSRFFAQAVAAYLQRESARDITKRLDEVHADAAIGVDPALARWQRASLPQEDW